MIMNKTFLFLGILFLSFNCISQNPRLSEHAQINQIKKELTANRYNVNETPLVPGKALFSGVKSTQADYGNPPEWGLVNTYGGSGKDIARKVAMAADGSFFVTGSFSGNISIGSNEYTCTGKRDAFLAKFQGNGSLIWFRQFSPLAGNTIDAYGIHTDNSGNVYFTGYYTGNVSFGEFDLLGNNPMNLFVAVANPEGDITMATDHYTFNPLEMGLKVDTDNNGNIFILGSTDGTLDFRHPTVIIKYAPDGTMLLDYFNDQGFCDFGIVGDQIYFIGTIASPDYIGDFFFDPLIYYDVFVAMSNTNMEFAWAYMAGHNTSYGDSYGIGMYISPNEDVYLTGFFRTNITWGDFELQGNGGFVAKCSSNGIFSWAEKVSEYYSDMKPTDITCNNESVFVSNYIEPYNSNPMYKIKAFSLSGVPGFVADFDNNVESINYNAENNSLIITQDMDELIGISGLDDTSLDPEWSLLFGGNSASSFSIGTGVDQSGSLYNFSYTSNQIDYFGQTINKGLFLTKQNGSGSPMWIVQFSNTDYITNTLGNTLIVDTLTNSVYITEKFYKPFIVPNGPTLTPNVSGSIFILKYDLNGNYQWARQEDFNGSGLCLAKDNSGNILLSGTFSGSINIGNTELVSAGIEDVFIAKYNGTGEGLWAIRAGGEDYEYEGLISTDAQDNVYLTGEFPSIDITIGDYAITLEEGDGNVLIAKLDPQGNIIWATSKAGSPVAWGDYYAWPTDIVTDNEGNSYIKGWHADSASFDNIMLVSPYEIPNYNNKWNKFFAKIDPDGNTVWANSMNEIDNGFDYNQFDIDGYGNVYSGLYVRNTVMFGEEFTYVPSGAVDLLIINYTNDGELNWVKSIVGSETGHAAINSVVAYREETVYVCGWFNEYLDFGNNSFEVENKTGFIGVLGEVLGTTEYQQNENTVLFELFPNPAQREISILLNNNVQDGANLLISDIAGKKIYSGKIKNQMIKTTLDLSGFSPGVYFAKLKSGEKTAVLKFIVE
jgi:hypothetical protein